jgi:hypothetical protein
MEAKNNNDKQPDKSISTSVEQTNNDNTESTKDKSNLDNNSNLSSETQEKKQNNETKKEELKNNELKKKEEIKNQNDNSNKENNEKKNDEEFSKNMKLIEQMKKDNYKDYYSNYKFCDFRPRENTDWHLGIIIDMSDDSLIIEDKENYNNRKYTIKINDSSKLTYFRKYSKESKDNFFKKRDSKEILLRKLNTLEDIMKDDYLFNNKEDNAWETYYFLHSKIFFGLDSAMKVNDGYRDENEGCQESLRIILCILSYISKYFKYLLDNKDDFINYENNKKDINN